MRLSEDILNELKNFIDQRLKEQEDKIVQLIKTIKNEERYLSRARVAVYLDIGLSCVDTWARSGKLEKLFNDGSVRFDKEAIDDKLRNGQLKKKR